MLNVMKSLVDIVLHDITRPLLMMRGWGIELLGYDPSEVIVILLYNILFINFWLMLAMDSAAGKADV